MIQKFIAIRNIGKFLTCNASGDVTFRRLTLILGENGKGKTTLSDVLRSLSRNEPEHIVGRKSLGSPGELFAQLLLEGNNIVTFKDGKWDGVGPRIAIYDSTFVDENVHSGNRVDHGHRKNLYGVIVGEEGVRLAKTVDEFDATIRDANKEIASKANVVKAYLPQGLKLEAFLDLKPDVELDSKISSKEAEIATLSRAKEVKDKAAFSTLELPTLPTDFEALLGRVLENISADAEQRVRQHLETHAKPGGEQWITQGLTLSDGSRCPFCGQEVGGIDLITAYRNFFSESYTDLKKQLAALRSKLEQSFGEQTALNIQRVVQGNSALLSFWEQFGPLSLSELEVAAIQSSLTSYRDAALNRLENKMASPLALMPARPEFNEAEKQYSVTNESVAAYNAELVQANTFIANKKKETEAGNLATARSQLSGLQAIKRRYEPAVGEACREYVKALSAKESLDTAKAQARAELDAYCKSVFGKYEKRINELLEVFGAGFRIGDAKTSYAGGNVSSSFRILINNVAVDLGDATTPAKQPSFRNTLSAGDRSTLALAFFIAKLESDPLLLDTIVLFDDPFTSQDKSRRMRTQHHIRNLADRCQQVLVLSHDAQFLKQLKDWRPSSEIKTLQFFRTGESNSTIVECDLNDEMQGEYIKNYNALYRYLHDGEGDAETVVRSIRPLLEGYLRIKQPNEFSTDHMLGEIINRIRNAPTSSPLHDAKPLLDDLEAMNEYSKKHHHGVGAAVESEPINDTELQTFVKKALAFVGGF